MCEGMQGAGTERGRRRGNALAFWNTRTAAGPLSAAYDAATQRVPPVVSSYSQSASLVLSHWLIRPGWRLPPGAYRGHRGGRSGRPRRRR